MNKTKYHILYCIPSFTNKGGTERVVSHKMNWLVNHGYQVTLLISDQGSKGFAYEISEKIKVYDLKITSELKSTFVAYSFWQNTKKLREKYSELISKIDPDIIVVVERGYEDFVIPEILPATPKIRELHSSKKAVEKIFRRGFRDKMLTLLYNRQLRKYDHLVYLTQQDAADRKLGNHFSVIPNLIPQTLDFRNQGKINKRIISVGRLDQNKNFQDQILLMERIVQVYPDYSLDIYGEGFERRKLETLILEKKLQNNVFLRGAVHNISEKYQAADFLIFTSRAEGFGMVLIEAMQHGLPVVSYDCPCGPSEIITDGEDGFLVPVGDLQEMESKVLYLINHQQERIGMGENAQKNSQRYLPGSIMPLWTNLFASLLK